MNIWWGAAFVLASYLLGSVPHLTLLAGLRGVRLNGDYHENLWDRAGKAPGAIGIMGEFIKGAVPVLVGRWLGFGPVTVALAGLAAVTGQMWPVFHRFDGEKGNSIAIAMVAALAPWPALGAVIFPAGALIIRTIPRLKARSKAGGGPVIGGPYSRSLPLGMMLCFLSLPVSSWFLHQGPEVIWSTAVMFILIMVRRLTAGLRADLKVGGDRKSILMKRLLYDRATTAWRR